MSDIVSVMIYIGILFGPFLFYFFAGQVWIKSRCVFYLLAYLPAAIFAALRGNVGTDTENYMEAYDFLDASVFPDFSVDYLFTLLMYSVKSFGLDFQGFSSIHAGLCLVLYSFGAAKLDKISPVFGLGVLPVLFVDATFNGLRYGLAFAVCVVALHLYRSTNFFGRFLLLVPPALVHSSLLFLFLLTPAIMFLACIPLLVLGVDDLLYFAFLSGKADSYSEFSRPGTFSGIMPVVNFVLLYCILRINGVRISDWSRLGLVALTVFILGLAIAQISYAGLRMLQIGVFLMAIHTASSVKFVFRSRTTRISVLIGLLGVVNFLRQIFIVGPQGDVIFHPYEFF